MEILSKIDYILTVARFVAILSLPNHGRTQRLPTREEEEERLIFEKRRPELFYDTLRIPDGLEKSIYLYKKKFNRYSFIVENDSTPFSITITPCASPVNWKVTFREFPRDDDDSVSDPFNIQKYRSKKVDHGGFILQNISSVATTTYLHAESRRGTYIIDFTPLNSETYIKVFATTQPNIDHVYPNLPKDNRVNVVSKSKKEISIAWKPVQSGGKYDHTIEYCVVFSRTRQFHSHCGALAHLHGDQPPTFPPYTGFGFRGEKKRQKALTKMASPVKAAPPRKIFYDCVRNKTKYTFAKAKHGKTYHVNVFAVDARTNLSSSYAGAQVKLKRGRNNRSEVKKGKMKTVVLRKKRQKLLFHVESQMKELAVLLQPCGGGKLRVRISKGKQKLVRTRVKSFGVIRLANVAVGKYKIGLKGERKAAIKILLSDTSSGAYAPTLPADARVRVSGSRPACDRANLTWTAAPGKQKYCLYKAEVVVGRASGKAGNRCTDPASRKKSEKVVCKYWGRSGGAEQQAVAVTETVTGLSPSTDYIFDVYVGANNRDVFGYQSARLTTNTDC